MHSSSSSRALHSTQSFRRKFDGQQQPLRRGGAELQADCVSARTMEHLMRRAIVLAREAEAAGGEPYGALIADASGAIVAEGRNHASNNPLWHGETSAIANLSRLINTSVYDVAGNLTLYTTAEPCPMCMGAIL
jgi:tRNA(Arg) A34 adenosine deaminase TadA